MFQFNSFDYSRSYINKIYFIKFFMKRALSSECYDISVAVHNEFNERVSSSLQQVRVSHSLCWKNCENYKNDKQDTKSPKIQNTYFAFECARGDILETRVWGLRELRLNCDFSKALRVEEGLDLTVYLAVHRLVLKMISLSNPGSTLTPTLNSIQLLRWAWAYGISSLFTTHHHNLFSQIL